MFDYFRNSCFNVSYVNGHLYGDIVRDETAGVESSKHKQCSLIIRFAEQSRATVKFATHGYCRKFVSFTPYEKKMTPIARLTTDFPVDRRNDRKPVGEMPRDRDPKRNRSSPEKNGFWIHHLSVASFLGDDGDVSNVYAVHALFNWSVS